MSSTYKILVQCDFDGTITEEDVSFVMLDAYADGDWRRLFREYEEGKISVGRFNTEAFAMVRADRASLLKVFKGKVKIRPGFNELVDCCHRKGFRLVVVSNGLDFYIKEILKDIGIDGIEVFSARAYFHPDGLKVQYIAPDGSPLDNDFKLAYVNSFLKEGYQIIYAGNGGSDVVPARQCHYIFATDVLLARCQETDINCYPLNDFNDIVRFLESR